MCGVTPCVALAVVMAVAVGAARASAAGDEADPLRFFETRIRPLLAEHCFRCHGPQEQNSGLRLDSRAALLAGGESGIDVLVPGVPDRSRLLIAVSHTDPDLKMPPPEEEDRLTEEEVAVLRQWVAMGAPWPDHASPSPADGSGVKEEGGRNWWAFRPLRDPSVPRVDGDGWVRNAIDSFVFHKLRAEGLGPGPEADRLTLLRRACFDLLGLPPTPRQIDRFLSDHSPDAWEKLIDRLLASPHYGERWARHWLDLARYAESDGYRGDFYRPHAWRYRDYVIRSLNDDKPWNRFVMEQLAGDEIAPHDRDAVIATGYLRHGIYEWNQRDARTHWNDIVDEMTEVAGEMFLGLSMHCARCHDHKFDPILQADYYRLRAFFEPVLWRDDLPLAAPRRWAEHRRKLDGWEAEHAELLAELEAIEGPARARAAEAAIVKFPDDVEAMARKPAAQRRPLERQLADMVHRQVIYERTERLKDYIPKDQQDRWAELRAKLEEAEKSKPEPPPPAFRVSDVGREAPPTYIPGREDRGPVPPGVPTVLDAEPMDIAPVPTAPNSTGRRTALARWLTRPDNPLTTRVIVNRIWQYHFGRGLVATSSDFGRLGERPSHPELLDWLAARFVREDGSFKRMHRLIMTSATYRQASDRAMPETARMRDPDNRWLWRYPPRRLHAEQVRDAMLRVSGELVPAMGGPSVGADQPRRSIYTKIVRNSPDPLLKAFDAPDGYNHVARRNVTTTPSQALLLMNGAWTLKRAVAFAGRLRERAGGDVREMVRRAFLLAYGREPQSPELAEAIGFIERQAGRVRRDAGGDADADAERAALVDFCHVLLNSNEFVYLN